MLKRPKEMEAAEAAALQEIHNAGVAKALTEMRGLNKDEMLVASVVALQQDINRIIQNGFESDSRTAARRAKARQLIMPTEAEDAEITDAANQDETNRPLTDEQLAQFKPARRGRGRPVKDVTKVQITIRLDADVLDLFRSTGDGWQTRMNDALREWAGEHHMVTV